MSQNVYDREDFFQEYDKLPRSQEGLAGALEWPLLEKLVGDVSKSTILDLGCGFGWFSRWSGQNGAKSVYSVDVSTKMIQRAKSLAPANSAVTYGIEDLETIQIVPNTYDLIYSSLAFHYIQDLKELFDRIFAGIIPGGRFIFSVEHPIFTASLVTPKFRHDEKSQSDTWPLDSYAEEGKRVRNWLADGVIKQHRKIETYVTYLLEAGFMITALKEWTPSIEYVEANPQWKNERHRPLFLILAAEKPKGS